MKADRREFQSMLKMGYPAPRRTVIVDLASPNILALLSTALAAINRRWSWRKGRKHRELDFLGPLATQSEYPWTGSFKSLEKWKKR
ncbi:MAG: hypothetical protein CL912_28100 [Deltaproteobacteria bacterium]|nr:hypothetical protein [Deltaproteobacteria bacterium]